jgi:hypothetical protein
MKAMMEHRKNERFYHEAPVRLEDSRTGFKYNGLMHNYSNGGMYLESDYAPRPNRKLHITVDNLPINSSPQTYTAQVKWRRLLNQNSAYDYGIGVQYF